MISRTSAFAAVFLLTATPSFAEGWTIVGAGNGHGETMTLEIDPDRSYIFECASDAVVITYTGVTDLLDIRGNGKVGDAPGSVMPEGAAMMALYTGKGDPQFQPAEYRPNPRKGWDLSLRLAKNDKALKSMERSDMLSLFTTGYTAAREIDADTRAQFKGFLTRCRG